MDLLLNIKNESTISSETVCEFLSFLDKGGFFHSPPIKYMFVKCDTDEEAKRFDPQSIDETMNIISDNGVENLSISFNYINHYSYEEKPEGAGHFTDIMYFLNLAGADMAETLNDSTAIDFYLSVTFSNTVHEEEWGVEVTRGFKFGGEGGFIEDTGKGASFIVEKIEDYFPMFAEMRSKMKEIFGDIEITLEQNDF